MRSKWVMTAVMVLVCAVAGVGVASAASPQRDKFTGSVRVVGMVEQVVLVDSRGRMDFLQGEKSTHEIPDVVREPAGESDREPGEAFDAEEYVELSFFVAPAGRYSLWLRPAGDRMVELLVQRSITTGPNGKQCSTSRQATVTSQQWFRVDLVLGPGSGRDACGLVVGLPIRKPPPQRLKALE